MTTEWALLLSTASREMALLNEGTAKMAVDKEREESRRVCMCARRNGRRSEDEKLMKGGKSAII